MSDIDFIIGVTREKESTGFRILGILVGILNILLLVVTFSLLWRWFISPIFGLAEVNLGQAYGILLLIYLVRGKLPTDKYVSVSLGQHIDRTFAILTPLFVGWIIHFFV